MLFCIIFINLCLHFVQSDNPGTKKSSNLIQLPSTTTYGSKRLFDPFLTTRKARRFTSTVPFVYDSRHYEDTKKIMYDVYSNMLSKRKAKDGSGCRYSGNISYIDFLMYSN